MAKPVTKKQTSKEKLLNNVLEGNRDEVVNEQLINNLEDDGDKQSDRNPDLSYFFGEGGLINKLTENDPTITFDQIKDEGINLYVLQYDNYKDDFRSCFNKIKSNEIKKAFIQEIFEKVQQEIGNNAPYDDFSNECGISEFLKGTSIDVPYYFQKVVDYLHEKENITGSKKSERILKKIVVRNSDLNGRLPTGEQIPTGIPLTDESIPVASKEAFGLLLSFELSKRIKDKIDKVNDTSNKVQGLFSNIFPAINTIVGENEEYKFDESKLGPEFQSKLQDITSNDKLNESDKKKQINNLRWEYYIKYLKSINQKIGNAIEQLYTNDFDYSKLDENTLNDYLDKITDLRLKTFSKNGINEVLQSSLGDRDFDRFSKFYKELANPNIKEIHLNIPGDTEPIAINIPIEKTIISQKSPLLKNIEIFGNDEISQDSIPFQYKIKKTDIENLNINEEDRENLMHFLSKFKSEEDRDNYIIDGDEAGNLVYLFLVINGKIPVSNLDSEKEKEIKETFDNPEKTKKDDDEEKKSEEEKKDDIKNFIDGVEKLGSGNKFENGSEIWLPMGNSELPGGGYQWMKIKINDIDKEKGTFKGKVFGGELKFSKNLEGKEKKFVMNEDTLKEITNLSKDSDKVWFLPNPDKSDFNSYNSKLNCKLGTGSLSFPDGVKWDGQKFTHNFTDKDGKESEKEVKYFGVSGDDSVSYKIKYNSSNRSFNVSSTYNGQAQRNDGKSENVRYSYSRDMDWNNFLIFFTQKGLIPQTEEGAQKAKLQQDKDFKVVNGGGWKLNWFSINNFKNVFKTITGAIKKKMDDYNKSQDEKLENILIDDWGLYNKLADILGFIPSIKQGLGELAQEHYNERDNRTRKKIEKYYKAFCADYDLPDTFDQEPPYIKIQGKGSLKNQILDRVKNATDQIGDPGIYQAAGLLLANIEKGGNAYRGLSGLENKGIWVKALLGKAHYEQFLRDKQKCIEAFSTEENKDKLQDALANSEMTYIINNVYGKDGGLLFGSHESRGLPGNTEKTNYIENPSKRILSEQFAKKLDDLTKDNFTKDGVIGKMPKHNYFEKAENDFYRLIKSSRFSGAMSELEGMISLARTDAQVYATKKCYLILMLSGILDFNGNKGLRKLAYTQGKTFGFAPAMLAKNIGHSEEIASLLDDFSGGDFSKHVTSYCHKKDLLEGETDIKNLINQVNDRFNEKKMKDFDDYVESIPGRDWKGKSKALQKLQENLTDYDNENPDEIVLKNAKLINSAGLNASADAVSTRLRIENGEFKGKDQDEKKDIKDFWKSCSTKIRKATENLDGEGGADRANKMLDKYLGRFGISGDSKQDIYKWINTAYRYKDEIEKSGKSDTKGEYCQVVHEKEPTRNKEGKLIKMDVPLGKIYDDDIKKILRYGLEGFVRTHRLSSQQLPSELKDALDAFQDFFETAFYKDYFRNIRKETKSEDKIFNLGGWDAYEVIAQKDNNQSFIEDGDDTVDSADFKTIGEKAQKALLRKIFNKDSYKNADISNMRKSLKNHGVSLPKEWKLFDDTSKNVEELQKFL